MEKVESTLHTKEQDSANDELSRVVRITGISDKTTQDALLNFFENRRRSGGGDIEDIHYIPEEHLADITFLSAEDAKRVSQKHNLLLDGAQLTLTLKELRKVLPKDDYKLHVMGLSGATTKDGLWSFMEMVSGEEVLNILTFGRNDKAIVTFKEQPDLKKIQKKCSTRTLDGSNITIEQITICDCIQVSGMKPTTTYDTIMYYFENPRKSGGGDVRSIEYVEEETTALVFFEDPSVVDNVVQREHIINGETLRVTAYYPCISEIPTKNEGKKEKHLKEDPQVMAFIHKFLDQEFQNLLQETQVSCSWEPGSEDVVLCSIDDKIDKAKWENACRVIEEYIHQIITHELIVPTESFQETLQQVQQKSMSFHDKIFIESKEEEGLIVIRGKKGEIEQLTMDLDKLMEEFKKRIEIERKKVTQVIDLKKPKCDLLSFMGFTERLRNQFQDLEAWIVQTEKKIHFKGLDQTVREAIVAVMSVLDDLKEHEIKLPKSIVNILISDAGNSFLSKEFKSENINAVVTREAHDDTKLLVTAEDRKDLNNALALIEKVTAEESVHLKQDQQPLTETEQWKALMSTYRESNLLEVIIELPSITVKISGIKEEVDKAKAKIEFFFKENSIITKILETVPQRKTFLQRYEAQAIKNIEESLLDNLVKITFDDDKEGVSIQANKQGIEIALKKVQILVDQVKEQKIVFEKVGIKKFFSESKGIRLLSFVEKEQDCIIQQCKQDGREWLSVFAPNDRQLSEADLAIKQMISEVSIQKSINNPIIKKLSQARVKRVLQLQEKYFTEIVVDKQIGRITISGVLDYMLGAVVEVYEIILEEEQAGKTEKHHELKGSTLNVQLASDHKEEEPEDLGSTSVLVSGISSRTTEDALENYFESKRRSSGGDVKKVKFIDAAKRVLEWGKHCLDQQPLTVSKIVQDRTRKSSPTAAEDQATEERSRLVRILGRRTKAAPVNFFDAERVSQKEDIKLDDKNGRAEKAEKDVCPICLDDFTNPTTLPKCKHQFCRSCIDFAFKHRKKCPTCGVAYGVQTGNMPQGSMSSRRDRMSLPGHSGFATIIISYSFPSGVQGPEHPNPGQRYSGTSRTAFLPDNPEGREVLKLLKKAFDARLTFTIGTSVTTGAKNTVTWNGIHHKTNTIGGPTGFGYPDPGYLKRVKEELAAKGIS